MSESREKPRPTRKLKGADLGDEYIFYNHDGDQVHVLNGTARYIYLLCDGNRNQAEIVQALVEEYDVDEESAGQDVASLLADLVHLRLLTMS
jgi:hypothetical protein